MAFKTTLQLHNKGYNRVKFPYFCFKNVHCDPSLAPTHQDCSNEGRPQCMFLLRNKNKISTEDYMYVAPGKDHVATKFTKRHKSVGGVKVLVLCTSSDNALYLY